MESVQSTNKSITERLSYKKTNLADLHTYKFTVLRNLKKLHSKTMIKIDYDSHVPGTPRTFNEFLGLEIQQVYNSRCYSKNFRGLANQNVLVEVRKASLKRQSTKLENALMQKLFVFKMTEKVRNLDQRKEKLSNALKSYLNKFNIRLFDNEPNIAKVDESAKKMVKLLIYRGDKQAAEAFSQIKFIDNTYGIDPKHVQAMKNYAAQKTGTKPSIDGSNAATYSNAVKIRNIAKNDYLREYFKLFYEVSPDNKYYDNFFAFNLEVNYNIPRFYEEIPFYYPNYKVFEALKLNELYTNSRSKDKQNKDLPVELTNTIEIDDDGLAAYNLNSDNNVTYADGSDIICRQFHCNKPTSDEDCFRGLIDDSNEFEVYTNKIINMYDKEDEPFVPLSFSNNNSFEEIIRQLKKNKFVVYKIKTDKILLTIIDSLDHEVFSSIPAILKNNHLLLLHIYYLYKIFNTNWKFVTSALLSHPFFRTMGLNCVTVIKLTVYVAYILGCNLFEISEKNSLDSCLQMQWNILYGNINFQEGLMTCKDEFIRKIKESKRIDTDNSNSAQASHSSFVKLKNKLKSRMTLENDQLKSDNGLSKTRYDNSGKSNSNMVIEDTSLFSRNFLFSTVAKEKYFKYISVYDAYIKNGELIRVQ